MSERPLYLRLVVDNSLPVGLRKTSLLSPEQVRDILCPNQGRRLPSEEVREFLADQPDALDRARCSMMQARNPSVSRPVRDFPGMGILIKFPDVNRELI